MNPPQSAAALQAGLSHALRSLHKALLNAEAETYGPVGNPFELLNLALHHESFAWLRCLSELMVELDEAGEEDEITADGLTRFRVAVEGLVGPRKPLKPPFRERYNELLQLWPPVAMAHGDVRRVLDKLPHPPPAE